MTISTKGFLSLGLVLSAFSLSGCGGGSSVGGGDSVQFVASTVRTLAGASASGTADGTVANARFNNPVNVALDAADNIYVADFDNNRVRKISTGGNVTTLVSQSNFVRPYGITVAPNGTIYVQTDGNDSGGLDTTTGTIWSVSPSGGTAVVVARNLGRPRGLVARSNSQLVIADIAQHDIRFLNTGTGAVTPLAGQRGVNGYADGTGATARFDRPYGLALTTSGNILVADQNNNCIRQVTPAGVVSTFAGTSFEGSADGFRTRARFKGPQDVETDVTGEVFVSDNGNHRIRRIQADGTVQTLAGSGNKGYVDGPGRLAEFYGQEGIAGGTSSGGLVVADGNTGDGTDFNRVRLITVP